MTLPVSVLIPAYNGAKYIAETLDAILSQTYRPAEVIVLDDGSTDDTRTVVGRFGQRVSYHFTPNGGICRARNMAASLAVSAYIAFCDQDDLWRKDKLEQQMGLHERHPEVQYSFTNFSHVIDGVWAQRTKLDDAPADFFRDSLPAGSAPFIYEHSLYDPLLSFQPVWPSTIAIARQRFREMNGFREEFGKNPSEDFEFTLRCVKQGPIGIVREPVAGIRRHPLNYSGNIDANTRGQIEILEYVLEHHDMGESTRQLVLEQIAVRKVERSYGAFREGEFDRFISLLANVPPRYLDSKTRVKLMISRLPAPLARSARKFLLKS